MIGYWQSVAVAGFKFDLEEVIYGPCPGARFKFGITNEEFNDDNEADDPGEHGRGNSKLVSSVIYVKAPHDRSRMNNKSYSIIASLCADINLFSEKIDVYQHDQSGSDDTRDRKRKKSLKVVAGSAQKRTPESQVSTSRREYNGGGLALRSDRTFS